MSKYIVTATQINTFEIEVEAEDEYAAIRSLDGWIEDDLIEYRTNSQWKFEA